MKRLLCCIQGEGHSEVLNFSECLPGQYLSSVKLSMVMHHHQPEYRSEIEVKRYCRKSADVDWYVRVGRKSMVQAETIILCARTLHHCKTPRQPPLKKLL